MDQRIQQALDGEINRFQLTADERAALKEAEADIEAVLNAIPEDPVPDLAPGVLARIRATSQAVRQPVVIATSPRDARPEIVLREWLWTPRALSFRWRPVYALAAVLLIAAVGIRVTMRAPAATTVAAPPVLTRFVIHVPNATSVALAGDFTGWQPSLSLARSEPGVWTVVVPLEPGVHTYSFVVDGTRWVADPQAPAVADGFGGINSRVAVLTPDARKL